MHGQWTGSGETHQVRRQTPPGNMARASQRMEFGGRGQVKLGRKVAHTGQPSAESDPLVSNLHTEAWAHALAPVGGTSHGQRRYPRRVRLEAGGGGSQDARFLFCWQTRCLIGGWEAREGARGAVGMRGNGTSCISPGLPGLFKVCPDAPYITETANEREALLRGGGGGNGAQWGDRNGNK